MARTLLERRVELGNNLLDRIHPGAFAPGVADAHGVEHDKWDRYNAELLRSIFDTPELASSYEMAGGTWIITHDESEFDRLERMRSSLRQEIADLESVVERLELYDLTTEAPAEEPATPPRRREASTQTTINIYGGNVGSVALGDVVGNINAHVANVSGPDAAPFRKAVDEFVTALAEDSQLPETRRAEVLEHIDFAVEAASQPPGKRRLPIIRTVLASIAPALEVSAGAVEAWNRCGPTILRFFGIGDH